MPERESRPLALLQRFRGPDEIRPLRLTDLQPADAIDRARRFSLRFPPANLTASPVYGVGGLGLVALAAVVTVVAPGAWYALAASGVTGALLGVAMIVYRRRKARTGRTTGGLLR